MRLTAAKGQKLPLWRPICSMSVAGQGQGFGQCGEKPVQPGRERETGAFQYPCGCPAILGGAIAVPPQFRQGAAAPIGDCAKGAQRCQIKVGHPQRCGQHNRETNLSEILELWTQAPNMKRI